MPGAEGLVPSRIAKEKQSEGKNPALVTVAITSYEREKLFRLCLRSVCEQTYSNLEICVFDNSVTDAIRDCVKEQADDRIVYTRNLPNISDNIVINHQKAFLPRSGVYHIVLSSDCALRMDAIELMVRALQSDPQICAVTSDICRVNVEDGQRSSRNLRFDGYTLDEVPSSHLRLDSYRMIRDAFYALNSVGIAYHTLIVSEVLANANMERVYLSQSHEHQAGLELLLQKRAFGLIRQELQEELVNEERFQPGAWREYRRFTQAAARHQFLVKNHLDLISRGFNITTLQIGLALLFGKCMFQWNERPFEAASHFVRILFPLLVSACLAPIYLPLGIFSRLRKYRLSLKHRK